MSQHNKYILSVIGLSLTVLIALVSGSFTLIKAFDDSYDKELEKKLSIDVFEARMEIYRDLKTDVKEMKITNRSINNQLIILNGHLENVGEEMAKFENELERVKNERRNETSNY